MTSVLRRKNDAYKLSLRHHLPSVRRCFLPYTTEQLAKIFDLIKQNATLEQAREFLRSRNLPHSGGSWDELFEKRFRPSLVAGLAQNDLVQFLRATEEYGRQHIFLYQCSRKRASALMDHARIEEELRARGALEVITLPRILDQPPSPTIADARWEEEAYIRENKSNTGTGFTLKFVETRQSSVFVGEDRHGDRIVRNYRLDASRAVNLFHLHPDGLLEMRIQSHRNSTQYDDDVLRMWRLADRILPNRDFQDYPVVDAKGAFYDKRHEFADEIYFTDFTFIDELGASVAAATGREADNIVENPGAEAALAEFSNYGAHCARSNLWFRGQEDAESPRPGTSRKTHILFTKDINEFVVTGQCSRADYEYVLGRIIDLNA